MSYFCSQCERPLGDKTQDGICYAHPEAPVDETPGPEPDEPVTDDEMGPSAPRELAPLSSQLESLTDRARALEEEVKDLKARLADARRADNELAYWQRERRTGITDFGAQRVAAARALLTKAQEVF